VKDKHVRLRVAAALKGAAVAADFTPRCHPDSVGTGPRPVLAGPFDSAQDRLRPATPQPITTHSSGTQSSPSWRDHVAFKAMGWGLKESCDRLQLLAGDRLDIAYSLGMNDHPEFGGLELTLRDVKKMSARE
jgi:hypothetical protein